MKPFLSKKAGVTFYGGSNYTVAYHANKIEIVCKIQDSVRRTIGYTHLYMMLVDKDEIMVCANWNDFLIHLDSIKDMGHFTSIMKRPCPLFHSLLLEEHPMGVGVIMLHEHDLLVIGKVIHSTFPNDYSPLALPFRSDMADIVVSMSNNLIDLYKEIEKKCPLSLWKE